MSDIFWKKFFKVSKSVLDYLLTLLSERKGKLSIGRVLLISVFVLAMFKWSAGIDLLPTTLTVLLSLLGYVMGTKVVSNVTGTIQNTFKNGETNSSINTTVSSEGGKKTPNIEN